MRIVKILSLIIISILFSSCENKYPNYKKSDQGIYYKYHIIGEKNKNAKYTDYIFADITYKTINDSIFFEGRRKFQITPSDFEGGIENCFLMLSKGDSADFIISANDFFIKTLHAKLPSFIKPNDDMIVSIKLIDTMTKERYEKEKQEFLAWIKDFEEYEQVKLKHYLETENTSVDPSKSGLHKILKQKGIGAIVEKGDTIIVDYEGKFLNGKKFDSTIERNSPFQFVYGTEWQVIKGLEIAIGTMQEGEKSIFIMPSYFAFGSKGSSTGIIPPFTSVIFEVHIKELKKGMVNDTIQ